MTSLPEIIRLSQHKTRVLIFSSAESAAQLVTEVLHFYDKEFDYFLKNKEFQNAENDFVIFETSNEDEASEFKPNIIFISDENNFDDVKNIFKNIVSGGILIYSNKLEKEIEELPFFFRKLSFPNSEFKKDNQQLVLKTEMGFIPINSSDENLVNNLEGIKILCQQFGIMEEEFYEPVMSFE